MSDEIDTDHNYRSEKVERLLGLKSTIEGLLSTHSINVWNTYGGLNRVCSQVEKILYHGLKSTQSDFGSKLDFWPFAHGLKVLNPVLAPSIDRISRSAEANKGYMWVRESLREHVLSIQLRTLTSNHQHLHKFYTDTAFLCDKHFLEALCTCLWAVEQNKVSVLAELDLRLFHHQHGLHATRSESRLVPRKKIETNDRRASWQQETLALAPPFASPKQESILCTSDEHAVPSALGVSSSPKETKAMAKDALRSVLRKSGSHSPTNELPNFSFYDSLNSDPLLNMDFVNDAAQYPDLKQTQLGQNTSSQTQLGQNTSSQIQLGQDTSSKKKTVSITRCQSEVTAANLVKVNEDVFEDIVKKKHNKKPLRRPEDVFSDSESKKYQRDEVKSTKVMKGHKRSRSDLGGIKVEKAENVKKPVRTSDSFVSVEFKDKEPAVCHDGYFPRPTQGQSLINYLSSQDFHTCANLDKENAHFSISEALIAAIEQMKWNHVLSPHQDNDNTEEGDSDEEILRLKQRIRIRKRERMKEKARGFPAFSDGQTENSSDSDVDAEGIELTMSEDPNENESNLLLVKSEGLSLSLASLYSDADLQKANKHDKMNKTLPRQSSVEISDSSHLSAESVAISLLKRFSEKQLPKASDLEWLVPEKDAPQKLLPLPSSFPVSPDDADANVTKSSTIKTRLRGNMEWAPPRYQIIFNIHPAPKRTNIMARQNFMCAGCGTRVERGYIKRFRYCEYLGKYFCHCCHSNALSYIPGYILRKWDFRKFYVSNFSRELINRILNEPLFNLMDINPMLYRKIRVLENIQDLRKQLLYLNKFLRICKYSESLQKDIQQLSSHWYEDVNMYSLSDLINVKSGQMYNQLKNTVTSALSHIDECKYCQGFGFICELCNDASDIIYPFQLQKVTVCQDCKSCFHKTCYVEGKCPKCARIEARRHQLEREIHLSETDDEGDI